MQPKTGHKGRFYRRALSLMAALAIFGYVVAFVQADRGTRYYNDYVAAYTACFQHLLENGATSVNCNEVREVREPLRLHRVAIAIGEPFLNMALSLTIMIILSPLLRRFTHALLDSLPNGDKPGNGDAANSAA